MQSNHLGQTGLRVSKIGLGLAALGRPGYITLGHHDDLIRRDAATMQQQAHSVLDAAYDCGIRYFDAARSYGKAEEFLGTWLQAQKPDDVIIASKWGYVYTADWHVQAKQHEVKEHSKEMLEQQFAETQQCLGSHLKIYQIHSATLESGVLDNAGVLDKLADLKQLGLKIGLSTSGVKQVQTLEKALRIERNGARLFDSVQATYNLLETSAGKTLELAHREGIGIIIKEALANGRLTERNQSSEFADTLLKLQAHAKHQGVTLDALAIACVLQQPWVDVVLSGATTVEHVISNVKALELDGLLDLEDISEMPEVYWQKRSRLEWN
jgi:aryl-alcohol dehydrogenase-like predicted oxidoreductase